MAAAEKDQNVCGRRQH